jgi:hypothetical protein
MVQQAEDQHLVEGRGREVELARVAADEPARTVLLRVRDVRARSGRPT